MNPKKKRVFDILQIGVKNDKASRIFDYVLVVVIVTNIAVMVLETFEPLQEYFGVFRIIEIVCILFFTVEYVLRIWTADLLYPELSGINEAYLEDHVHKDGDPAFYADHDSYDVGKRKARWKFITSFDGIVELFTILPLSFLSGFVVFRMLRVVRIFHLFRLNAKYDSFNVITDVLKEKKNQILSSTFILLVLMLSASLCMYSAEHEAQPEVFTDAFSGLWWAVSTVLTVGYGDMYPVTVAGKVMAIIIAILGVGVVAIPTGIISAGFVEHYNRMQREAFRGKETVTLNAAPDSGIIGYGMARLDKEYGISPLVIIRDGCVVIPTDDIKVQTGDILVYYDEN